MKKKFGPELLGRIAPEAYANISGELVRRARMQRNLSMRDLAARAGISKTTLLRIEADEPVRVESLIRLCAGLVTMPDQLKLMGGLQALEEPARVIRASDTPFRTAFVVLPAPKKLQDLAAVKEEGERQRLGDLGFASGFLRMIPNQAEGSRMQAAVGEMHSKDGVNFDSGERKLEHSHPGEEFVYCLQGPMDLVVDGRRYRLETGDAAFFRGDLVHNYTRPDGDGPAPKVLMVWTEEAMEEQKEADKA